MNNTNISNFICGIADDVLRDVFVRGKCLDTKLSIDLDRLTRGGHIAPADLRQSAIGPGMEIYSNYSRVETISGEPVVVREAFG